MDPSGSNQEGFRRLGKLHSAQTLKPQLEDEGSSASKKLMVAYQRTACGRSRSKAGQRTGIVDEMEEYWIEAIQDYN